MSQVALVDAIFDAAFPNGDAQVDTDALWVIGITLLADVLLRANELDRERMLRGLTRELRAALTDIQSIMRGSPYPRTAIDHDAR